MKMIWRLILINTAIFLLFGCADEEKVQQQPMPDFTIVLDHHHMMDWILDPPSDLIWDSAGTIITAEGERDLSPTTDAAWEKVASSAAILAESGNLLMLPGRSLGVDWNNYAKALTLTSIEAMEAAKAQNKTALFDAGGNIYQACLACHQQYALDVPE